MKENHQRKPLPALAAASVPEATGSDYPQPFAADVAGRQRRTLGDLFGLTIFGVNHVTLAPGAMSSQRHWHNRQDELVYMLEGELVLVTDAGQQVLTPGMVAGFPAGAENGHHLINRSHEPAVYLEVGDRTRGDTCEYPDIDMRCIERNGEEIYVYKDGTPYEGGSR